LARGALPLAQPSAAEHNPPVPDHLSRGVIPELGLRVVFARVGDTARASRALHALSPTSAYLFAQALGAAALFGATQRRGGRANLQIVCDGPLRGLVVDAEPDGALRGYVRVPWVHFGGDPAQAVRAALGGTGHLAVRLDPGDGTHQRSLLDLRARSLPEDLRRWFATSQVAAAAADVAVVPRGGEPLGDVAAILVQQVRDEDDDAIRAARERVAAGALARCLEAGASAGEVIAAVAGPGFELQADVEVAYRCGCSPARARVAVSALGPEGIAEILGAERKATITCEFCRQQYVLGPAELEDLARQLAAQAPGGTR
jgi:molecular chaperone Hsp33